MDSGVQEAPQTHSFGGEWIGKCKALLDRIGRVLGKDKHAFWVTIDPKLVPDYYNIIKDPLFFGQIEEKLKKGRYSTPMDFHHDITKSFNNCFMYNPIGDYFRILAERASNDYEAACELGPSSENYPFHITAPRLTCSFLLLFSFYLQGLPQALP